MTAFRTINDGSSVVIAGTCPFLCVSIYNMITSRCNSWYVVLANNILHAQDCCLLHSTEIPLFAF